MSHHPAQHVAQTEPVVEGEKIDAAATTAETGHSEEYQEYLIMCETFSGDRMKKLNLKIDLHLLPPLILIYMMTYVDRTNVGNARLFGAEEDLGLSGTDWNIGLSLLFVTFALGAPIASILGKKYTTRFKLPVLCAACGITILGAGLSNNRAAWFSLRLLLGLTEAGIPGIASYVLSTWYPSRLFTTRASWFYFGGTLSGAVSGLLAYGLGQLDYTAGWRGWRWIYVLEGAASIIIGGLVALFIPGTPEQRHRWVTPEEQRFLILQGKYSYGADKSGNSTKFRLIEFFEIWKSPHYMIPALSYFSFAVGIFAFSFTLPTIIRSLGFTAAAAQALSAPPYIAATFAVGVAAWLNDKYQKRCLMIIGPAAIAALGLVMMWVSIGKSNLVGLCYTGCMVAAIGFYPLSPAHNAIFALNNAGQTKRSAALGSSLFFSQVGGIIGSNIYLKHEAPHYPTGFGVSCGLLVCGNLFLMTGYWFHVGSINKKRAAMTEEEIRAKYTPEELENMGDRSPFYVYSR